MKHDLKRGDRIWLQGEKRSFYVRALNERFVVCTRPYATVRQLADACVLDFEKQVRGRVFGILKSSAPIHCKEILEARITGTDGTPKCREIPLGKVSRSNYNRLTGWSGR